MPGFYLANWVFGTISAHFSQTKTSYMRYTYLFLLLLTLFISACNCHEYIKCAANKAGIYVTGYTAAEADSIYLRRYRPDNTFAVPLDSMAGHLQSLGDTLASTLYIEASYDYDIVVSPAGRHYKISGITASGNKYEDRPNCCFCKTQPVCFNYLSSCDIDGTTVYIPGGEGSSANAAVYLVK